MVNENLEFIKSYENDGNLNYDDLSSSDISETKKYGPVLDPKMRA
ncbi:20040_t:CDS:2 [Funneliformis geosporum]|nr:20040_t:CDS:2 [Funneliformis geosporum]